MSANAPCPTCGSPLPGDAPMGISLDCLLSASFGCVTNNAQAEKLRVFQPPTADEFAAQFPQLEVLELLGRGGMGAVYKARQNRLDRAVVLKILPPLVGAGPAFAERFERQARALAELHHPCIVTLYEFGEADGLYYFLMEFVDGNDAAAALQPRSPRAGRSARDHGDDL